MPAEPTELTEASTTDAQRSSLLRFSDPVRSWFSSTFAGPTAAQEQGWSAIADRQHTLILAPTGSGKTLAAFLWGIDSLLRRPTEPDKPRTRIVYVSPLRALAVDVDKNLRAPLHGIAAAAETLGLTAIAPTTGMRTGDTDTRDRRRLVRHPPDILITTPESLYLMLTSKARETLTDVETVIIDEIHAVAGTKRGAHLSLTLERLEQIATQPPQRIALSATQRPLDEIARFLGGKAPDGTWRLVAIVDAGTQKQLDVEVVVPIQDMGRIGEVIAPSSTAADPARRGARPVRRSIWPSMHPRLLDLIEEHQSTLVFVNARRMAERLATKLNELAWERSIAEDVGLAGLSADRLGPIGEAGHQAMITLPDPDQVPQLVRAHHGSLSRQKRLEIEEQLKSGTLKGLVATSSLELGIDMGAVDLVIQVESPGAVSRGLQRIGRAGHAVGEPSTGKIFPKHRADLLEAAVVVDRMRKGLIEETRYLRNPVDVLAQHIVAMCAMDDWTLVDLARVIRGSANFADITDEVLANVLDLLAGRYPSDEFSELRPRVVWDRIDNTVRARKGAQRLAVTNPGTIPDRGLFGVFLPDGTRVGELDEEMVYESRPGEVFLLGASTWRIEEITFQKVVVTPAPGQPGKMPFWRGDGPGRPIELGRAIGEFTRTLRATSDPMPTLIDEVGLDEFAAGNLVDYLDAQAEATGAVPDDRTIVVERFRDEIGDWRICIHTPFGAQVHAPWAIAIRTRIREDYGTDLEMLWSDDGIVLRLPESLDDLPVESIAIDPTVIDDLVIGQLPDTSLFASRFREAAGRALLLPRRRPGQRTPLWQQRQRSADLLKAASKYPDFPIVLETVRECINDVFDLPALRSVLTGIGDGSVQLVVADTPKASPFAQSLLFGWIAVYMYEGDAPLAERRAAALALDRDLLSELLGAEELRELLDPDVIDQVELELQRLVEGRQARDRDELHDVLRDLGPQSVSGLIARSVEGAPITTWVEQLLLERRVFAIGRGQVDWIAAVDDAARLRDGLGLVVPDDVPAPFGDPVEDPLGQLILRHARTHGPFLTSEIAADLGASDGPAAARLRDRLGEFEQSGRLLRGEFRPGGREREWCDPEVLRRLRRRSLAVLRKEVEPVDGSALARFVPRWQGVGVRRRGPDGLAEVLGQLQGAAIAASVLEADVLRARMEDYRPGDLDALCTSGELIWVGAGAVGASDGRIRLLFRDQARLFVAPRDVDSPADVDSSIGAEVDGDDPAGRIQTELHGAIRDHLARQGASFWTDLVAACQQADLAYGDDAVLRALWDLVWAGEVTNDSLAPVRSYLKGLPKPGAKSAKRGRPRPGRLRVAGPPAGAGRWSLVAPLLAPPASPTESAHARAIQLLERYGVLTRETALGEGAEGGFAGVYPVLKALEDQGKVRRGYFVDGLGAAQFALPGAVDRLRNERRVAARPDGHATTLKAESIVLAATDPAQPFGAALPWPESGGRPARLIGAHVVVIDGYPAAFLDRSGRGVITFAGPPACADWPRVLGDEIAAGDLGRVEIAKVDGEPISESPVAKQLGDAGWTRSYKGWVYRP